MFKLMPLFLIYCVVFMFFAVNDNVDDETVYAQLAENISKGSFVEGDRIWYGPGYPLFLAPFARFGIYWYWVKAMNIVFLFTASVLVFKMTKNIKLAYIFGLFPPFFVDMLRLLTEPFAVLLATLFCFLFLRNKFFMSGLTFAALIMVKVIFGYVALAALIFYLLSGNKVFLVYLMALILCLPWLAYTHYKTGKILCFSVSGGLNLFWMTTSDGYGSWLSPQDTQTKPELAEHKQFFASLEGLSWVDKDDALKKEAIKNITQKPAVYLRNWFCNIGRLFLNFPFSHKLQRPRSLYFIVSNVLYLAFMVKSRYERGRNVLLNKLALVSFVYLSGISLLAAEARFLNPIMPMLFLYSVGINKVAIESKIK